MSSLKVYFSLPERSRVTIAVYDAAGREIGRPLDGEAEAGAHAITWHATDRSGLSLGSGVYYLRMIATPASGGAPLVRRQSVVLVR